MKQYVIIGNGIAAAGCIEGIRKVDKDTPITVISGEKYPVYCRPLISYYLQGKTDLEKINYRKDTFYSDNGCEVIYGETADRINSEEHTVALSNGDVISYDKLLVAAGSSPFVPRFEGIETVPQKFSFMTLDDTLGLEKAICETSKVLIVGAGLIGLKCAEGLMDRVGKITVCDLADNVLSSILDNDTAPMVQAHLEKNGVEFLMGDSVKSFDVNTATMQSGKQVSFDILVTAVGVRPNTSLVADAGGEVNRGIVVNTKMETSVSDVYAAGDCSEGYDLSIGKNRVLALLPNAYMGGFTAGVNMAGGSEEFDDAIPMNSIGFMGLHIMTAGNYSAEKDGGKVYSKKYSDAAKKFFVENDELKGYILVGNVLGGGIYTSLIREKTPLSTLDFDAVTENASLFAFSSEIRRKKLGGVV
ncbi:MAG: NAD(P)/FAD-dependent oxidoreductase [Ruminococcus sp.]